MKVVVTGSRGQLGQELQATRPEGVDLEAWDITQCDVTRADEVLARIRGAKPDLVIHAAADTKVDQAEERPEYTAAINADGAEHVARAAVEVGARLITFSTDFVFDGQQSSPYRPTDATNPLSAYGRSKLDGERRTFAVCPEATLVRTSWLYSRFGRNFPRTMLRLFAEKDELGVVCDQVGSPTNVRGLAEMAWSLRELELSGIYHWADAGAASWYDLAVAVYEEGRELGLVDRDVMIRPIGTADYPTPATRPPYSVLDCRESAETLGTPPAHWRVALRRMLRDLRELESEGN